jgi:nucleoside diphosphate kinase
VEDFRNLIGATDLSKAAPNHPALFAKNIGENAVHGAIQMKRTGKLLSTLPN